MSSRSIYLFCSLQSEFQNIIVLSKRHLFKNFTDYKMKPRDLSQLQQQLYHFLLSSFFYAELWAAVPRLFFGSHRRIFDDNHVFLNLKSVSLHCLNSFALTNILIIYANTIKNVRRYYVILHIVIKMIYGGRKVCSFLITLRFCHFTQTASVITAPISRQ